VEEAFLMIGKTLGHYRVGEQLGRIVAIEKVKEQHIEIQAGSG
jgi:hypothetical protein